MKKYIGAILSLASVGMLFYIIYDQKDQIKELKTTLESTKHEIKTVDSLKHVVDSVNTEVFINQTKATRYEIALENLKNENPLAAAEFEMQLSHTE